MNSRATTWGVFKAYAFFGSFIICPSQIYGPRQTKSGDSDACPVVWSIKRHAEFNYFSLVQKYTVYFWIKSPLKSKNVLVNRFKIVVDLDSELLMSAQLSKSFWVGKKYDGSVL